MAGGDVNSDPSEAAPSPSQRLQRQDSQNAPAPVGGVLEGASPGTASEIGGYIFHFVEGRLVVDPLSVHEASGLFHPERLSGLDR